MALIKQKLIRGIPCDYWRLVNIAVDLMRKTTTFTLGVYYSQDARMQNEENIQDYLTTNIDGVDFTRETFYNKIKESKIGHDLIDGNMVEVQKNWFFDAKDVFEPGQAGYISPVEVKPIVEKPKTKKVVVKTLGEKTIKK